MNNRCPTCGRHHRVRRAARSDAPLPLFDWRPLSPRPAVRLLMLHHDPNPEGEPRPALLLPGRRVPIPFRNLAAALAAKAAMEAAHAGR